MSFKKAELSELNAQNQTVGAPVAVQFNPATLRLQFSNRSSTGGSAGAPARQRAGEGSSTVSFDLHFDTADEGSAGAPLSVLHKTAQVERFVRPRGRGAGEEAPPRVQFEWGGIKVQGVMESCSLDLELFAEDGTPLRARCSVQIKGQDPSYALAPRGAGTGAGGASGPGLPGGGLGSALAGALGTAAQGLSAMAGLGQALRALSGESLPQLAARAGQDPKDWRQLSSPGASNPQQLPAGTEVGVPAASASPSSASSSAVTPGAGVQSGALGETAARRAASTSAANTAAAAPTPAALTRAGGLAAAQTLARSSAHTAQVQQRLAAFATSAPSAPSLTSVPSTSAADDRPYGFGLPLKPRRGVAADAAATSRSTTARLRCHCAGACACKH